MARWQTKVEVGQKFWQEGIGSGKIDAIDWKLKMIYVNFYEKGRRTYEFDVLFGNWSDHYGGTWMIYGEIS